MAKKMVDAHKRWINYLRISITNRCNLRCTYCMPEKAPDVFEKNTMMSYDEMARVVRVMALRGLRKVRITGGEPLVRKGVVDLVSKLNAIPGIQDIGLTTNGILLTKLGRSLYDAGLRRLNISLDTLIPEKFAKITRRDQFDAVWRGIEEAEKVGFDPIKLNVVLQKGVNDNEIEDFVGMTMKKNIHVRFIEFMPVTQWNDEWKKKFMSWEAIKERAEETFGILDPVVAGETAGPAINYKIKGAIGTVGFITSITKHFCDKCNRIRMTADGKIRQCLFSQKFVDFKEPMRDGCSDEYINYLMDQVMATKPAEHKVRSSVTENDRTDDEQIGSMVGIGG